MALFLRLCQIGFQKVIYTREDIVHENDGVKILALCIPELMQWYECCIAAPAVYSMR